MRDLRLEQEMALLRSLMAELKAFRDVVQATLNTEVVVPENEQRFEELRQNLPALSTQFQQEVGLPQDDAVTKLFSKLPSLPDVIRLTDLEKTRLYEQWHRHTLSLYTVQGRLKMRKERLDALKPTALAFKRFILNPFVLLILVGAIVLLVLALR